jgi:hypothetical protein
VRNGNVVWLDEQIARQEAQAKRAGSKHRRKGLLMAPMRTGTERQQASVHWGAADKIFSQ